MLLLLHTHSTLYSTARFYALRLILLCVRLGGFRGRGVPHIGGVPEQQVVRVHEAAAVGARGVAVVRG